MLNKQKNIFPDTYQSVPLTELLNAYTEGPKRLKRSIAGLSENELKRRVIENKWTVFEILLHVVDSEITGAVRFRQCYAQSDTRFPFYNQDVWAEAFRYQEQTMEELENALTLFRFLRETTSNIFEQCKRNDWTKTGLHPETGEITLRNLLELYADHSERHIQQILERRKLLEKPIEFPLLLKQRLY